MSECAFFIALVLTCGYLPLVLVTFPLVLFPIWLPATYLVSALVFSSRQVDPGRILGCGIGLTVAIVLLTIQPPFFGMILVPPFYAVALLPWVFSGKESVPGREVRIRAAIGLLIPIIWCFAYYSLGGEFVLFYAS